MSIGTLPPHVANPMPDIYTGGNYVVIDFETTVHSKGSPYDERNNLVLAVWERGPQHPSRRVEDVVRSDVAIEPEHGYKTDRQVCWGNEFNMGDLVREIEEADFLVAHNAKFELGWLERCGLDISQVIVWDTMLGEYVIGGNRWVWQALSLENCAQRNFGEGKKDIVSAMYKVGLCSTEIPESWLERYCIQDVALTHRLFKAQLDTCTEKDLLPIVYTRCLLTPVLVDLEQTGLQLDATKVLSLYEEKEREFAILQQNLDDFTGGININSPIQLREFLYETLGFSPKMKKKGRQWVEDLTPSGLRKTDVDTVASLKATTKQQEEFLDLFKQYRTHYSELTKYLRKLKDCVEEAGGHLTAAFNQFNTQTHRLSSSGRDYSCQFQNFPRAYKHLFTARNKGWLVGECDGAQLEFRVAAHLGRDATALGNILDPNFDAHVMTACYMTGEDYDTLRAAYMAGDSWAKTARQDAKSETFKPLYGGKYGTEDQVRWYKGFRELYSGIAEAQDEWIDEVLENKYLITEWGLRYYWPDTKMDRSGYVRNTTSICNYPVQAFATAEIIPLALVCFWHRLRSAGLQMFIVNTVHDSIIVELPPEEEEIFHELSQQCLIDDVYPLLEQLYGIEFTVPLGAGVACAPNWGTGEEHKYEADPALYSDGNYIEEEIPYE